MSFDSILKVNPVQGDIWVGGKPVYMPLLNSVPRVGDEICLGAPGKQYFVKVTRVLWFWKETFGGEGEQWVRLYAKRLRHRG